MSLRRKLLFISFFTILLLAIVHSYALKLSWYWTYEWSDIPVHILGGYWVSLTALWASLEFGFIDKIRGHKKKAMIVMLSSVVLIGLAWEVFELMFKITDVHSVGFWSDTFLDILSGFAGGVLAYLYFTKTKKGKPIDCTKYHLFCTIGKVA